MRVHVRAFARLHDVTAKTIYQWASENLLTVADGTIDVDDANSRLLAAGRSRIDPAAPLPEWLYQPAPPRRRRRRRRKAPAVITESVVEDAVRRAAESDDLSLVEAMRRRDAALAEIRELEAARLRGDLVAMADFDAALRTEFDRVRSKLSALPMLHATRLSRVRDPQMMEVELTSLVNDALRDLSRPATGASPS